MYSSLPSPHDTSSHLSNLLPPHPPPPLLSQFFQMYDSWFQRSDWDMNILLEPNIIFWVKRKQGMGIKLMTLSMLGKGRGWHLVILNVYNVGNLEDSCNRSDQHRNKNDWQFRRIISYLSIQTTMESNNLFTMYNRWTVNKEKSLCCVQYKAEFSAGFHQTAK